MPTLLQLFRVQIKGPSMAPTLKHGDRVLVRPGNRGVRVGDVVLARFLSLPDLLVVKRAARPEADGWWILGDNEFATDDSRVYGVAEVVGRVLCRYRPHPQLIRRRPNL